MQDVNRRHTMLYLRLKSVEIGYTIPQHITRKFKVDRLRIFANGYNLFTLSNLDFVDRASGRELWIPVSDYEKL